MRWFNQGISYLSAGLIAFMVSIVNIEIFFRFIIRRPMMWPTEIATFTLVFITFVGSAAGITQKEELIFTGILRLFSPSVQRILLACTTLLSGVFLILFFIHGINMTIMNVSRYSPVTRISLSIPYASIPFGAFLMFINKMYYGIKDLRETGTMERR